MSVEEKGEIRRASSIMALFTLLSRLLGLVRNQILSHFFGTSMVADAFVAAFTIPNALRRLFGEGALTPALVSTLTRALQESENQKNPRIWQSFVSRSFFGLNLVLVIVCGLGMLVAPWLVGLYVPEFRNIPEKFELTVSLTRYLFPFILFMGWFAFFMGVLNSLRSFGISAFGPAALNLAVIIGFPVAYHLLHPDSSSAIYVYGGALLLGGIVQAAVQVPKMIQLHALPRLFENLRETFNDPRVVELGRMLLPSAFAMSIYQLNIIVNRVFASEIPGAVSHLFYADLILELPVSLIAVSLGTAVLPSFSRLLTLDDKAGFSDTFKFSMEGVWLLSIPAMLGMLSIGVPIVSSLYFSGRFSAEDLQQVSNCLGLYALGLPFFAGIRIINPVFFSMKDTRTPALVGFICLGLNFIFAWKLSKVWGVSGIALATSLSSFFNFTILSFLSKRKLPHLPWLDILKTAFKILGASAVMGFSLRYLSESFFSEIWLHSGISLQKILCLGLWVVSGISIYLVAAKALGLKQLDSLVRRIRQ